MTELQLLSAFKNPEEFKRLIKCHSDLHEKAKLFPDHAERLINIVLEGTDEFKRLIRSNFDLRVTASLFPGHAEKLINIVLENPEEFKRLIKNNYELLETAKLFPKHAEIFGKSSVGEAADAAKLYATNSSCLEIGKNAFLISQACRTNTGPSFLKDIPFDLQIKIAGLTANPLVHNEKESEKMAYQNFGMPSL